MASLASTVVICTEEKRTPWEFAGPTSIYACNIRGTRRWTAKWSERGVVDGRRTTSAASPTVNQREKNFPMRGNDDESRKKRAGGRREKRDVGRTRRVFRRQAASELCAPAKGVSRQPEGVTPAYSYAGNGGRRKRRGRETRRRFYGTRLVRMITSQRDLWKMCTSKVLSNLFLLVGEKVSIILEWKFWTGDT